MSEMVERVAEALMNVEREDKLKDYYVMARAAIAAMREPTETMWARGTDARLDDGSHTHKVWRDMIDAALQEDAG